MAEFSIKHEVQELLGHVWRDLETGAEISGDEYWRLKNAIKSDPESTDGGSPLYLDPIHPEPIPNNDAERRIDVSFGDPHNQPDADARPTGLFSGAFQAPQSTTPEQHPTKPGAQVVPDEPVEADADPDVQQVQAEQQVKPALGPVDEATSEAPPEDPAQVTPVEGSTAASTVHAE